MATRVMMFNPANGLKKNGYFGFSWTYLFFGFLVPLFRGELIISLIHLFVTVLTGGLWQIIMSFLYNKQYMIRSIEAGYILKDDEVTMYKARKKIGIFDLRN